jgi:hypothetical protein
VAELELSRLWVGSVPVDVGSAAGLIQVSELEARGYLDEDVVVLAGVLNPGGYVEHSPVDIEVERHEVSVAAANDEVPVGARLCRAILAHFCLVVVQRDSLVNREGPGHQVPGRDRCEYDEECSQHRECHAEAGENAAALSPVAVYAG